MIISVAEIEGMERIECSATEINSNLKLIKEKEKGREKIASDMM